LQWLLLLLLLQKCALSGTAHSAHIAVTAHGWLTERVTVVQAVPDQKRLSTAHKSLTLCICYYACSHSYDAHIYTHKQQQQPTSPKERVRPISAKQLRTPPSAVTITLPTITASTLQPQSATTDALPTLQRHGTKSKLLDVSILKKQRYVTFACTINRLFECHAFCSAPTQSAAD
jgi:hypothetical protein